MKSTNVDKRIIHVNKWIRYFYQIIDVVVLNYASSRLG